MEEQGGRAPLRHTLGRVLHPWQDGGGQVTGMLVAFGILLAVAIVGGKLFDIDDWKRR